MSRRVHAPSGARDALRSRPTISVRGESKKREKAHPQISVRKSEKAHAAIRVATAALGAFRISRRENGHTTRLRTNQAEVEPWAPPPKVGRAHESASQVSVQKRGGVKEEGNMSC